MAREKARAAALEARVATLRALVDAEDAETAETAAETAAALQGAGGSDAASKIDGGDTAEGRGAPLAARARNKRLAGEAASARRDAAAATARAENAERRASVAESAAASRDLAVAELERHLVATTGERTPKTPNTAETSPSADGEISAAASASLLPMVAAQRDRHKRRASDLEIRVAELEASLATATEERERSRADAAALYDKVIHVQDYYHASSKTGLLAGAGAGPGGARIVRVDDAGVALDKEDGPLAALAARRAARYGCFPGGGAAFEFDTRRRSRSPGPAPRRRPRGRAGAVRDDEKRDHSCLEWSLAHKSGASGASGARAGRQDARREAHASVLRGVPRRDSRPPVPGRDRGNLRVIICSSRTCD